MHSRPPKQHYITASHIERWADDGGQVEVGCLVHRDIVSVPFGSLYYTRETASGVQDNVWSELEGRAKTVIDDLHAKLGESLRDLASAEAYLTEDPDGPSRVETLIDFVVLHHARSLVVPLRHIFGGDGQPDAARTSAQIDQRWQDAHRRYHACGVDIVVHPDDSVPLGAVPVLDIQDWGGQRVGVARFIMPLSPHVMICGVPPPDLTPGQVRVKEGPAVHEDLLRWQVGGAPGLIDSPFVVCEPSSAKQAARTVLRFAEGGDWHWFVLEGRMKIADNVPRRTRVAWKDRQACQRCDSTMLRSPFATESGKAKIREASAERARLTQRELDDLNVAVCRCRHYRQDRRTSAAWEQIMPQVVCDAVRRKRNQAQQVRP